jgi:hypothetical protein
MKNFYRFLPLLIIVLFLVSCGSGGGGGAVAVTPTGSATLAWTPPTTNDNTTPLTDLAGFKVHYGTSPGLHTRTIDVPNAAATTYTVTGLPLGATYYFVVTAYNTSGVESVPSNEANKTL